ncbi:hypothetical protein GQ53DRAFT_801587 [Thozetella sp. PMI_491]|nr:hypothetical protein GQ53DRAFT_801587 [Thozetella sp. PMI_491]
MSTTSRPSSRESSHGAEVGSTTIAEPIAAEPSPLAGGRTASRSKRKREGSDESGSRKRYGPGPVTRQDAEPPADERLPNRNPVAAQSQASRIQDVRRAKNNDSAKRSRLKKMATCMRLQVQAEAWRNNAGYWKDIALALAGNSLLHGMGMTLEEAQASTDLQEVAIPGDPEHDLETMRREVEEKLQAGDLADLGDTFLQGIVVAVSLPRYPDPALRSRRIQGQQGHYNSTMEPTFLDGMAQSIVAEVPNPTSSYIQQPGREASQANTYLPHNTSVLSQNPQNEYAATNIYNPDLAAATSLVHSEAVDPRLSNLSLQPTQISLCSEQQ